MNRPPRLEDAPGHRWQPRADGPWVCIWIASRRAVAAGYRPKTQRIWPPTATPRAELDDAAKLYISSECQRLQDDMHSSMKGRGEKPITIVERVDDLIERYKTDPDSDYQNLRHKSVKTYNSHLRMVSHSVGQRLLSKITGRDLKQWFKNWSADGRHIPRAHYRMTVLRLMVTFGATLLEHPECIRLRLILSGLEFQQGKPREKVMTAQQVADVRRHARADGRGSMALAQAFQFDLMLRQKDVIGAWVPIAEPGISSVTWHGNKWLYGLDWKAVDETFTLKHRLSKSLRGKMAVTNAQAGKVKTYQLRLYSMVMEELALSAGCTIGELSRDMFPASGPIIVCETTQAPYSEDTYRRRWRDYANAAGIDEDIQNRDSRASGATEAEDLGLDVEMIQKALGHSKPATTRIYTRGADAVTAKVAEFRLKRPSNKQSNT